MQDDSTGPAPSVRPDLTIMFHQGATAIDEGVVDLVADAMRGYAFNLRSDGRMREEGEPSASEIEIRERVRAGLEGAVAGFSRAIERYAPDPAPDDD